MFQKRIWQVCVAAIAVMATGGMAAAQAPVMGAPSPVSEVDGHARRDLASIYRQGVGTGYSVGSLNQLALRSAQAPNVGQTTRSSASSFGLGTSSPSSKPFSSFSPSPTVSPYINLFREDIDGNSDLNYNTLVRPMLQQQQFNQQMQQQSMEISRRLQTLAAQADFTPGGSTTQYPTGHKTVFMHLGHYYPTPTRQQR